MKLDPPRSLWIKAHSRYLGAVAFDVTDNRNGEMGVHLEIEYGTKISREDKIMSMYMFLI